MNDTYGTAMAKGIGSVMPKFEMPYTIAEEIAYDPAARDLSVEVAKAKAANADALLMVSRLNDAMLLTRELVKQRWTPQAIMSMGPGWYEDQYLKTLGKLADGPISFVPWYDPHKKLTPVLEAALAKADPGVNLNTNHIFTFEALLVAADAYKRAGSTDPKALADAIRSTNITDNVSYRARYPVRCQGAERQGEERRRAEHRRQARDIGAEGCRQWQARVAAAVLPKSGVRRLPRRCVSLKAGQKARRRRSMRTPSAPTRALNGASGNDCRSRR